MHTRRKAIKTLTASLGIGSLAGCTEVGSDMRTFEAIPAMITVTEEDNIQNGKIMPTVGSQVTITERINPIGEITVRSYGVTHTILEDPDDRDQNPIPIVGEVLTFTTPKVNPPGLGEQNPAGNLSIDRNDFSGTLTRKKVPGQSATRQVEFNGMPPAQKLLGSGYRGIVGGMEIPRSLERVESGVRGEAKIKLRGGTDEDINVTVSGNEFEHNGDYVFGFAWKAASDSWIFTKDPDGEDNGGWKPGARIHHPNTCPSQQGPGSECGNFLKSEVTKGRKAFITLSVERIQVITEEMASVVEDTRELLEQASDSTSQEEDKAMRVISETRDTLERIDVLISDIQDALSSLTIEGADKGPSAKTVREKAGTISDTVARAEERVADVRANVDGDETDYRMIEENLNDLGTMAAVVDFSCSMYRT